MISQSTFTEFLTTPPKSQEVRFSYIGADGSSIGDWMMSLTTKGESERCVQIETTLKELMFASIEDPLRLQLMQSLWGAIEQVTASLHQSYKFAVGPLSSEQLETIQQIQSLYYLSVLVFNGIIERSQKTKLPPDTPKKSWRRRLALTKAPPDCLALAIYWSMRCYQQLLFKFAIAYQKPPAIVWQQLNRLYRLALHHVGVDSDLSLHTLTNNAESIQALYCQICLHSLLNLATYRRQDILGVYRMLPSWSPLLTTSLHPDAKTRVFVDLKGDIGPEYLSPYISINPYDDHSFCLFIELTPLLNYLESRLQASPSFQDNELIEQRLSDKVLTTLRHHYFNRGRRSAPRYLSNQQAVLMTGFSRIHYHISGQTALADLIHEQSLADSYLPRPSSRLNFSATDVMITVDIVDQSVSGYRFCAKEPVRLMKEPTKLNSDQNQDKSAAFRLVNELSASWLCEPMERDSRISSSDPSASPRLQVMSLFAIRSDALREEQTWTLGIIRWIESAEGQLEAGGQVLGYSATACGLRLQSNDGRRQDFVAAILIAGSPELNTTSTLIMPRYHFNQGDRVVLRLYDKQSELILHSKVLTTDDIDQFEVVQVATA